MTIHLKSITAAKILETIDQFLSKTEQQWLNQQLNSRLQQPSLSLVQKQTLVDQLCGAWTADQTIAPIFQEIEHQRTLNQPRDVSF